MPWVGAAKRAHGLPLEVPEREAAVLEQPRSPPCSRRRKRASVVRAVRCCWCSASSARSSTRRSRCSGTRCATRRSTLPETLPDLDGALRPALTRIGARSARLLLALPPRLDRERSSQALEDGLRSPWLAPSSRHALVDALARSTPSCAGRLALADDAAQRLARRGADAA